MHCNLHDETINYDFSATSRIRCIGGGTFRRSPRLAILSLQDNDLAGGALDDSCGDDYQCSPGLERTVFSSVSSLTSLHLDNNPLHCDCHLSWMAAWMTSSRNPNNQQQQQSTRTTWLTTSQAVNPNNKIRSSQRTICTTPGFLSGRKLADISQSAMVCTGSHRDPVQAR